MALFTLLVFISLLWSTSCLDSPSDKESGNILDGSAVVEVGNTLKNPLVKFIGGAIKNLEKSVKAKLLDIICRMPSCLNWSDWSECVHIIKIFGIQNRTRICRLNQNEKNCSFSLQAGNETQRQYETKLCELDQTDEVKLRNVTCPSDYKVTEHGFCLKYVIKSADWAKAQSACEEDGGNLINIDSETKSNDIAKLFADEPAGKIAWIDGIRRSSGSSWEYRSGIRNSTFINWEKTQPDDNKFPSCKYVRKLAGTNEWKWNDHFPCTGGGRYMCEIEL